MSGDMFDFSAYEALRASLEVAAVRVLVSALSGHAGIKISYREQLIVPQDAFQCLSAGGRSRSCRAG